MKDLNQTNNLTSDDLPIPLLTRYTQNFTTRDKGPECLRFYRVRRRVQSCLITLPWLGAHVPRVPNFPLTEETGHPGLARSPVVHPGSCLIRASHGFCFRLLFVFQVCTPERLPLTAFSFFSVLKALTSERQQVLALSAISPSISTLREIFQHLIPSSRCSPAPDETAYHILTRQTRPSGRQRSGPIHNLNRPLSCPSRLSCLVATVRACIRTRLPS